MILFNREKKKLKLSELFFKDHSLTLTNQTEDFVLISLVKKIRVKIYVTQCIIQFYDS